MERKRKGSNGISYHESRVPPSKRHELDREAKPKLAHHKYTVGWICAIDTEYAAAQEFLDEEHAHPHNLPPIDGNHYTFGRIGLHNVVMAVLAEYGMPSATAAAMNMQHSFPNVEIRLMVGIGGGAPSPKNDIRLGDIVVSAGSNGRSGVFQYDFGKDIQGQSFQRTRVLGQPPERLCGAVVGLQARYRRAGHRIEEAIDDILHHNPNLKSHYTRPDSETDKLYKSKFVHPRDFGEPCAAVCEFDPWNCVERPARTENKLVVHYGVIASANQVMKNAETRDKLADEDHVICFEMEAAGLAKNFPCLVIRGICDYSDTHKNKEWQGYAAMTAAAYAKDLLNELSPLRCASPAAKSTDLWNSTTEFHREDQINERRQEILESLSFSQIDARKLTIKKAHANSCKWVLNSSEYRDWLDHTKREAHDGFFWIKGKPGAGKSTLMKFISTNYQKKTRRDTLITFFFNARGEELEKSTIGMYRSLLFQLLNGLPELRTILDFPDLMAPNTGPREWTIDLLKIAFEEAVLKLKSSSVTCFVDALDECDQDQIRDMVSFFKRISEEATSSQISFQVCFSSRHYPQIKISKAVNLVLETEKGHEDDIVEYLKSNLDIGDGKIAQVIRNDLQEKASGVFMWVVLVVDILNKEYEGGGSHRLRKRLEQIPGDLDKLFREILTRDCHNREELLLCIQWVLFAKQPLKPEELYFAILSGIEAESTETLSDWDPKDVTIDVIKRFIIASSKGLTEVTKAEEQKVQFIHESVRDFLLKHDGLSQIYDDLRGNIEGQCHERLKHCCLKYLSVAAAMKIGQAHPTASSVEATTIRHSAEKRLPFLRYATQQILHHADTAEGLRVSQRGFLQAFDLSGWIDLDNLLEKHKIRRHTTQASLLYILAEHNAANLIGIHPSKLSCFNVGAERYGAPILAALVTRSFKAVHAFLTAHKEANPMSLALSNLPTQYQQSTSMLGNSAREFKFSKGRGIFSHVAELGDERVAALLLELENAEPDATDPRLRTPLSYAAEKGKLAMAHFLLETGKVDVNHKDQGGKSPLSYALRGVHGPVVQLLVKTDRINTDELDSRDESGRTPLSYAASRITKNSDRLRILLATGKVEVDSRDSLGRTPLSYAAGGYHSLENIKLLLATGKVEVDSRDDSGRTPLSYTASGYDQENIKLLLATGKVEVDSRDDSGRTPLSYASGCSNEETVKLLLATGKVEVDSRDDSGRTPLSYAASGYSQENIKLLLATGKVEVDSRDSLGRTPLSYAAGEYNSLENIKLLLATGKVEVDSRDDSGRTPLSYTASGYDQENIKLLLATGKVEVDSRDDSGRTPLSYASGCGNEETIKLLLATGKVEVDSRDSLGRTPLSYSTESSSYNAISYLLETGKANSDLEDKSGNTPSDYAANEHIRGIFQRRLVMQD